MARDKRIDSSVQHIEEELDKYSKKADKKRFLTMLVDVLENKLIELEVDVKNKFLDGFFEDE